MEQYFDKLIAWGSDRARDILVALIFLFVGFKVCKLIVKGIKKSFERSKMDKSVSGFLLSLIKWMLYIVVIITAASIVGIQVTSFVALLGTAGFTVGLALQGSLQNFAGGVLILLLKPFKVGDYIIENDKGCEGIVISIDIFYTRLRTMDNRVVIIPNGNIMNHSLVNVTAEPHRIVTVEVGVAYDSDLKRVKELLAGVAKKSSYRVGDEQPQVYVASFDDSAILMGLKCMVKSVDYRNAIWDLNERIKEAFDKAGVVIPFKQVEVTMKGSTDLNN